MVESMLDGKFSFCWNDDDQSIQQPSPLSLSLSPHLNGHSRYQNVSILDFIGAKDNGGGGDNWSYKMCKAPVKSSPSTNQHPVDTATQFSNITDQFSSPRYHLVWITMAVNMWLK